MRLILLDGMSPDLETYLPFITTSYSKTLRNSCNYFSAMPTSLFFPKAKESLLNLIEDGSISLLVDDEDLDLIMGYCLYNKLRKKIDIVFIKRVFRGNGLMKMLVPFEFLDEDVLYYTLFLSKSNLKLRNCSIFKNINLSFNPYL
jgi:hypothetical protein